MELPYKSGFNSVGVISLCRMRRRLWRTPSPYLFSTTGDTKKHRVVWFEAGYFFLSTKNRASSFSGSARSPKLSSSAKASLTSASARFTDSSMPNSDG